MQYQVLFASVLALVHVAAASTPACLLAALAEHDPTDLTSICGGDLEDTVLESLADVCDDDALTSAYDVFAETCMTEVNVEVAALKKSSSSDVDSDDDDDSDDADSDDADSDDADSDDADSDDADSDDSSDDSSSSDTDTDATEDDDTTLDSAANGMSASLVFIVTGLAATSLTSVIFL